MISDSTIRRFTCVSGLLSVALYVVVCGLLLDSPEADAAPDKIAKFYVDNRTQVLIGVYVEGVCICATWAFLAGLWAVLRRHEGSPGLFSALGALGGFAIFALALAGFIFAAANAYLAGSLDASTAKLLQSMTLLCVNLTGFPTAISNFGYTVAIFHVGERAFPWHKFIGVFSVVIVCAHLTSGGCFASSGILSPSGVGIFVAPVLYYLWIAVVSIACVRGGGSGAGADEDVGGEGSVQRRGHKHLLS